MDQKDRYFIWYGSGAVALVLAYVLIFMATGNGRMWASFVTALANILPLAGLGLLVRPVFKRLENKPLRVVASGMLCLAILWSLGWYLCVAVTIGLANFATGGRFELMWLTGPALQWQAYQGLVVFGLICVGHLAVTRGLRISELEAQISGLQNVAPPMGPPTQVTMMVRTPEGLKALNADEIVAIEAADDESVIVTRTGKFPSRTSLAHWVNQLDTNQFVRIHRSRMINLKRLISADPLPEGRMMLHMEGGNSLEASRSGARAIRDMIP